MWGLCVALVVMGRAEAAGRPAIEAALRAFVDSGTVPGYVAVLITPAGGTTLAAGGLTATGVTGVASVTKVLTTLAMADLIREGKLSLDDPVRAVIPAARDLPKWKNREITIRDLATHTSALPSGQAGQSFPRVLAWYSPHLWRILFRRWVLGQTGAIGGVTWDDLFAYLAKSRLERAPGSKFEYSNVGMGLLGHAIATKAGTTYEEAVLARVCRPLGMAHTMLTLPAGAPAPRVHLDLGPLAAAGSFHSSAADLALLVQAALGAAPKPLAEDFTITFQPQARDTGGKRLALGWQIDEYTGRLYHAGLTHAFIGIDRKTHVGTVLILGAGLQGIEGLGLAMLDALGGGKPDFPRPRVAVELPAATLAAYAGTYRLDAASWVEVTVQAKGLKAQFRKGKAKGGAATLVPESDRKFFCRDWDCNAEFAPDGASVKIRMYSFEGVYKKER
ncbi:MAG: serine hydrolase [Candidatus Coatesbacteria bacterium]